MSESGRYRSGRLKRRLQDAVVNDARTVTPYRHLGSRGLTCFEQAVMGLRWFHDRTGRAAFGHDVSRATAYRYQPGATAADRPGHHSKPAGRIRSSRNRSAPVIPAVTALETDTAQWAACGLPTWPIEWPGTIWLESGSLPVDN